MKNVAYIFSALLVWVSMPVSAQNNQLIKQKLGEMSDALKGISVGVLNLQVQYSDPKVMPDIRDRRLFSIDVDGVRQQIDGRESRLLGLIDEMKKLVETATPSLASTFCTPCDTYWDFNSDGHKAAYLSFERGISKTWTFDWAGPGDACADHRKANPVCASEITSAKVDPADYRQWVDKTNGVTWLLVSEGLNTRIAISMANAKNVDICSAFGPNWRRPGQELDLKSIKNDFIKAMGDKLQIIGADKERMCFMGSACTVAYTSSSRSEDDGRLSSIMCVR